MAEVKLDILVGVRSFVDFGQLSVSHTRPARKAGVIMVSDEQITGR